MYKKCYACKKNKKAKDFHKCVSNRGGLQKICKSCSSEIHKTMYKANREKYSQSRKIWRMNNKDIIKKRSRIYYIKNRVIINKKNREYKAKNKDIIKKKDKKYRIENKERFRLDKVNYNRKRLHLKRKLDYKVTKQNIDNILNNFNNRCFNCKSKNNLCIDHHFPLSKGYGLSFDNAVVLCGCCNSSKNDKMPSNFYSSEQLNKLHIMGIRHE